MEEEMRNNVNLSFYNITVDSLINITEYFLDKAHIPEFHTITGYFLTKFHFLDFEDIADSFVNNLYFPEFN